MVPTDFLKPEDAKNCSHSLSIFRRYSFVLEWFLPFNSSSEPDYSGKSDIQLIL